MNRPATKTSTRYTCSASSGMENFILAKSWSQDPLFVVISFFSILTTSSEFSTGHAFHLFKLILFCGYFFCAPKWRKNIKKIKWKSQRIQKNNDSPKIEKKERGKGGTISRGAHREHHLSYVCVCWFPPCSLPYFYCSHQLIHLVLGMWIGQQLRQVLGILIQLH